MDNKSVTIVLTEEQISQIRKYAKSHFNVELEEENVAIFFKLMVEEMFNTSDIKKEIEYIEEKIHNVPQNTIFTLSDLYTIDEWDKKAKIKKILGKIFYLKVIKDSTYKESLGIETRTKNSSNVQRYEKIK